MSQIDIIKYLGNLFSIKKLMDTGIDNIYYQMYIIIIGKKEKKQ